MTSKHTSLKWNLHDLRVSHAKSQKDSFHHIQTIANGDKRTTAGQQQAYAYPVRQMPPIGWHHQL